ncbi:isoprenylcysteine carboxylmethyltransferase family protein [Vibrio cholerae]|nr:isoprenylcysteine carboxylmethyltransferase family protein [Vibrio cholerae]
MSVHTAALLALALYAVGVITTFGIRSWMHRRRTGSTGFKGISGTPGSIEWWGGILLLAAMVLGAAGPALALAGVVVPPWLPGLAWAGTCIAIIGFLVTLAAQSGMGASWRIGVNATERTDLVTNGLFAVVRNPIFTAMLTAITGIALMVPTLVSGAAVACLFFAVEIQVRIVEEPYLNRIHPHAYPTYTAKVGRFLPGIGRTRTNGTFEHRLRP